MTDRRGHRMMPVAMLASAVLAITVGACTQPTPVPTPTAAQPSAGPTTPEPTSVGPTAGSTASPGPSESAVAGLQPCGAADLKASHGLVEGAAGSRLAEVVLSAGAACSVEAFPVLGLRDGTGAALVGGTALGEGRLDLVAGATYFSNVRLANWCLPDPVFPLTLTLRLGPEELAVTGGSFPEAGDLPPCNGDGPPILEGSAWEPAP